MPDNARPYYAQSQGTPNFLQQLLMGTQQGVPEAIGWGARHPIQAMRPVTDPTIDLLQRLGQALSGIRGAAVDPLLERVWAGALKTPEIQPHVPSGRVPVTAPTTPTVTPSTAPLESTAAPETVMEKAPEKDEAKVRRAYVNMAKIGAWVDSKPGHPNWKRAARAHYAEALLKDDVDPFMVFQWVDQGSAGFLPLLNVMTRGVGGGGGEKAPPGIATTLTAILKNPGKLGYRFVPSPDTKMGRQFTDFVQLPANLGYLAILDSNVPGIGAERTGPPKIRPLTPQTIQGPTSTTEMPSPEEGGFDEDEMKALLGVMGGAQKWGIK